MKYYIDLDHGDDANDGTSAETAWNTFDRIPAKKGDEVWIRGRANWKQPFDLHLTLPDLTEELLDQWRQERPPVLQGD